MPDAALAAPIDQLDRVPRKTPLSPPRESAPTNACGLRTEFLAVQREVGAPPETAPLAGPYHPLAQHVALRATACEAERRTEIPLRPSIAALFVASDARMGVD